MAREKEVRELGHSLAALRQAEKRLDSRLEEMCEEASRHGARARATRLALASALAEHERSRSAAQAEKAERELLAPILEAADAVQAAKGSPPVLARAISLAEKATTGFCCSCLQTEASSTQLAAMLKDLGSALETAWRAWLQSPDATSLWRSLSRDAPERAPVRQKQSAPVGIDAVRLFLQLLAQWDSMHAEAVKAGVASAELGAKGLARSQRGRVLLLEALTSQARTQLQVACRLAAAATSGTEPPAGSAFPPAFLPALAEAASEASKASGMIVFILDKLTPEPKEEEAWIAAAEAIQSSQSENMVAVAEATTASMVNFRAGLHDLEPKPSSLRAFALRMTDLLKTQLDAAERFVVLATTSRGRATLQLLSQESDAFWRAALKLHSARASSEDL
ncbi:hypothetical protein AB1Y20_018403 [Prymnesium parvum]|uniref:Uncharacterized protein n=1 Tax=Prymnesium parvum TaxID=97485 RepID=A0AB34JS52_PRYPA